MMKLLILSLFFTTALFADRFTLENETPFRTIAIQWASSARMAQESNEALLQRNPLAVTDLYYPRQSKAAIPIPKNAAYFRVLVWDTAANALPEFLTNWIEFIPGKTYLLKKEHLTPLLLINGMGC